MLSLRFSSILLMHSSLLLTHGLSLVLVFNFNSDLNVNNLNSRYYLN